MTALADLVGRDLIEQALACPVPVCDEADHDRFRSYRADQSAGVAWLQGLPVDRLAGLLRLLLGEVRHDLTRSWEDVDAARRN
jgi:hypothetical protein